MALMDDKIININYLKLSVWNYGALLDTSSRDHENTQVGMDVFSFHLVLLKHDSYGFLFGRREL